MLLSLLQLFHNAHLFQKVPLSTVNAQNILVSTIIHDVPDSKPGGQRLPAEPQAPARGLLHLGSPPMLRLQKMLMVPPVQPCSLITWPFSQPTQSQLPLSPGTFPPPPPPRSERLCPQFRCQKPCLTVPSSSGEHELA